VLKIVGKINEFVILRLFEGISKRNEKGVFGIWLCNHYEWKCIVINDEIPVDDEKRPIGTIFKGNIHVI
jgi:hypothetical protein